MCAILPNWPTFETGGVFVPAEGTPILLIGPECETYARARSVVPHIILLVLARPVAGEAAPSAQPNVIIVVSDKSRIR